MILLKSHPLLKLINSYVIDSPQPSDLSYMWNFGSLLAFSLIIQIAVGLTLAMIYKLMNVSLINKPIPKPDDDFDGPINSKKTIN